MLIAGCSFFASCGLDEFFHEVVGNATLSVTESDNEDMFAKGSEISFSSCVTDMLLVNDTIKTPATIYLGAKINLLQAMGLTEPPYMVLKLQDTIPGIYSITNQITMENVMNINTEEILNNFADANIFALYSNDTVLCVAKSGEAEILTYEKAGKLCNTNLKNVVCYCITPSKVEYLKGLQDAAEDGDMAASQELNSVDFDTLFPTITLNGEVNGRRMIIYSLIESIKF